MMFFIRKCLQITWSIIPRDSIQMVNNPSFRQWIIISFLPNYYMLKNITSLIRSRMFWLINSYVSVASVMFTIFPARAIWSRGVYPFVATFYPRLFSGATLAPFSWLIYRLTTINTSNKWQSSANSAMYIPLAVSEVAPFAFKSLLFRPFPCSSHYSKNYRPSVFGCQLITGGNLL